jgi:hypothetical protein
MKWLLLSLVAICAGCTQPDIARQVLEGAGYKDIEMQGYDLFSCSKDDTFHDKFTATGPTGKRISGTVCAGLLFKNSTIRFD